VSKIIELVPDDEAGGPQGMQRAKAPPPWIAISNRDNEPVL
jgi:hypothetical protein